MKTFVSLLAILLAMVFVVPAFAGEEPYKAAVWNDNHIPYFHISPKVYQFTHPNTAYYDDCKDVLDPFDPRVDPDKCEIDDGVAICPSKCQEGFNSKTAAFQPEVCCAQKVAVASDTIPVIECPDYEDHGKTALTGAGNSGWYEWVIALPKKPEGEINLEIQCGVLKPNSWDFLHYDAIMSCAAETGEPIGSGMCTRVSKGLLKSAALPKITVTAVPGCQNDFEKFNLTAYRNPGDYIVTQVNGKLANNASTQILNGTNRARIALKPCMEKTVLIKWPTEGTVNAMGQTEANLEAGDLIKVRMDIPTANTVDIYCGKYSVTLGGIGEPSTLLYDEDCDCINVNNCQF